MIKITFSNNSSDKVNEHFFTSNRKVVSFLEAYLVATVGASEPTVRILKTAFTYLPRETALKVYGAIYDKEGDWKLAIEDISVNS